METALAVMFSSPTLNIVVLTMLFSIFPFHMALLKLGATFVLVLLIVPFISKKDLNRAKQAATAAVEEVCEVSFDTDSWGGAFKSAARDYWKSFSYIFIRTFPLMLLAGFWERWRHTCGVSKNSSDWNPIGKGMRSLLSWELFCRCRSLST